MMSLRGNCSFVFASVHNALNGIAALLLLCPLAANKERILFISGWSILPTGSSAIIVVLVPAPNPVLVYSSTILRIIPFSWTLALY